MSCLYKPRALSPANTPAMSALRRSAVLVSLVLLFGCHASQSEAPAEVASPLPGPGPAPTTPGPVPPATDTVRVAVPAGTFIMGSPADEADRDKDEGPQQTLSISAFEMDKNPVTVAEFVQLASRLEAADAAPWSVASDTPASWQGRCTIGGDVPDAPATCVPWATARAYCQERGGGLPTEAQWEYAARAGAVTAYPGGSDYAAEHAVSSVDCGRRGCLGAAAPVVDSGPRCNSWGLCDLSGNVWEWTSTDYRESLGDDLDTPVVGEPKRPVHRGGAWLDNEPFLFRFALRGLNYPGHGLTGVGFRCAYAQEEGG